MNLCSSHIKYIYFFLDAGCETALFIYFVTQLHSHNCTEKVHELVDIQLLIPLKCFLFYKFIIYFTIQYIM